MRKETKKANAAGKKKKNRIYTILLIIIILIFVAGAGLLLYPTVSNLWNEYRNKQLITDYGQSVAQLTDDTTQQMWEEAEAYNEQHTSNTIIDAFGDNSDYEPGHPYDEILNPNGDGIMGSLEIPKIDVNLAIYHGVGEDVLEKGAGHVEGTSLPIGGESTHAVIAGHRGLPSAKLFTDLDQMEVGDVFYIHVLDQTLAYQVDQIVTVLPEDTKDIAIEEGKDYVTLITCTPYGVNSHRLLVRGTRIPYNGESGDADSSTGADTMSYLPMILLAVGIIVFIILAAAVVKKSKKKKQQ